MKNVPLKELKLNLSALAEEASKGTEILVTKHNRAYIRLLPVQDPMLHRGKLVGQRNLRPVLREASHGRWLKILEEDRNED